MLLALALCLFPQAEAGSHAALHPAAAELFVESPDVPALLAAYPAAPMARLFADAEALAALRKLLGRPELTGEGVLQAGLDALPLPAELTGGALESLRALSAASLSVSGNPTPGALLVLDWRSAEAATEAASAFTSALPAEAWVERDAARVAVGVGSVTREAFKALSAGSAAPLSKDAAWGAGAARLGAGSGALVARGFHRRQPHLIVGELAGLEDIGGELNRYLEPVLGAGALHWRMALEHGRFVSESFAPGVARPLTAAEWLAPAPLAPALLDEVHPGSFAVAAASFDREGLRRALAQASGADLSAAPLFDKLGGNLVLFVQPLKGMAWPRTILLIELKEEQGALEDLLALAQSLAAGSGGIAVKSSKYKDVPYVSLDLPQDLVPVSGFGDLDPVLTVVDGYLFLTNGSLSLKKEIRRRQGDAKEAFGPAAYPWTGGRAALPAGATAAVYVDWAAQVDGLFALARAFGPMAQSFLGDLPFELTSLPSPLLFTRHMPPTWHTVRPLEGGLATRHEAGFAFETWVGLGGLAALVIESLESAQGASPAPVQVTVARVPADDTRRTLLELRTALSVYKLDHGAFPDALARLVEPAPNYPAGYLDGRDVLPVDAWGRAFRYARAADGASGRVWSTGEDGVDQDGAGDDVREL
jgi:hypothetical protein